MMLKSKQLLLTLVACLSLAATAQSPSQAEDPQWYLEEVVGDVFVRHGGFEYYYTPSASSMASQRAKGEVSYFLNSPTGQSPKKVRALVDRLMARYDDIVAMGEWHFASGNCWKEFRHERNRFRVTVKRKALDDGTYYVSLTESVNYYKSLDKKSKPGKAAWLPSEDEGAPRPRSRTAVEDTVPHHGAPAVSLSEDDENGDSTLTQPVTSRKHRPGMSRRERAAMKREQRLQAEQQRQQQRQEAQAQKAADRQQKAELKRQQKADRQQKAKEKRQQKERQKTQQREQREQEARERAQRKAQATQPADNGVSKYHCSDVALWLSEKYDFTQTGGDEMSCTMFSTAVKDVEMAKLAVKNALKGSGARMAIPWRLNPDAQIVETGYTVGGHVLVFSIAKQEDDRVLLSINEVTNEQFDEFKQHLNKSQPNPTDQ